MWFGDAGAALTMMLSFTGNGYCRQQQAKHAPVEVDVFFAAAAHLSVPKTGVLCLQLHSLDIHCAPPLQLVATHLHVPIHQPRCVHKVDCCKAALLAGGYLCRQQRQPTNTSLLLWPPPGAASHKTWELQVKTNAPTAAQRAHTRCLTLAGCAGSLHVTAALMLLPFQSPTILQPPT